VALFAILGSKPTAGVALVITLILLAVITFMTVTFLVVTRSESGTVRVTTDQATAMLAAEVGLEQAKIQIIAPMLAFTNVFTPSFMVSTNYQSSWFTNGSAVFAAGKRWEWTLPSRAAGSFAATSGMWQSAHFCAFAG